MPEHSYGLIPYRYTDDRLYLLLVHMYGSGGGTHWAFPKGRPEPGETPLATAVRETKEEVGLTPRPVRPDQTFTETYSFTRNGVLIEKTTTYFVALVAPNDSVTVQPTEICDTRWCTPTDTEQLLTFAGTRAVLTRAITEIVESTY